MIAASGSGSGSGSRSSSGSGLHHRSIVVPFASIACLYLRTNLTTFTAVDDLPLPRGTMFCLFPIRVFSLPSHVRPFRLFRVRTKGPVSQIRSDHALAWQSVSQCRHSHFCLQTETSTFSTPTLLSAGGRELVRFWCAEFIVGHFPSAGLGGAGSCAIPE